MWRGPLVEAQVAELLGAAWRYEGSNWGGWDFVGPHGHRLEVKQSAALQPWGPARSAGQAGLIRDERILLVMTPDKPQAEWMTPGVLSPPPRPLMAGRLPRPAPVPHPASPIASL